MAPVTLPELPPAPGSSPLLEVTSVSRRFGGFVAVQDVSFAMKAGQILGVAGPNGAGKSTLFNLISGVPFGPSSGEIRFNGMRIAGMRPDRISRLGVRRTFQAEQVFSSLTVRDNVELAAAYLRPRGMSRRGVADAAAVALDVTGITGYSSHRAGDVPLLVKKKLMIASAIVHDPALLMLDEPAGGLDEDDQAELIALLRVVNDRGLALLIIEHVLSLLRAIAPTMIVMAAGRELAAGPPAEVLADRAVIEAYLGHGRAA